MNRRHFLRLGGVASAGLALPAAVPDPGAWRTFEITTRVEILNPEGATRVWLPVPLAGEGPFQKSLGRREVAEGGASRIIEAIAYSPGIVAAEFPAGVKPVVTLTSSVATQDYAVDLSAPRVAIRQDRADLQHFLQPTKLIPTDGIVRETAAKITKGAASDGEKARAIYEWVVDNTFRDPKTRGCGRGDIRFMLESRDLGGKCADLNALYVGLARAAGVPARDVYGIRVAPSRLGYRSLGTSSETVTKAQHCRAEVYLEGHGWVPVDPADVRKVVLEEPPGRRALEDSMVVQARRRLFGSWEMNWIAYNFAHDVELPGSAHGPLPFFMYPQAETGGKRLDSLDPDSFRYEITAREIRQAER